jgi:hypothetical protein
MGNVVYEYAQELMRNQGTCIGGRDQLNVLRSAEVMDQCINRGWRKKLENMRVTKYDGYLLKVHNFALKQIE